MFELTGPLLNRWLAPFYTGVDTRGLLQNLLVTKSKKRGKFAVIAGGRRLRAIEMIVARGAWTPDAEIECKLLEGSEEEAGEALRRGSRAN